MNGRPSRALRLELTPSDRPGKVAFHMIRWALLAGLASLTYLLFPVAGGFEMLSVGEVAPHEIIAEFEFPVPKSPERLEAEREGLEATVRPIYELRQDAVDSALAAADTVFTALNGATTAAALVDSAREAGVPNLTLEHAEYLMLDDWRQAYEHAVDAMLRTQLPRGVPLPGFSESVGSPQIIVRRGDGESSMVSVDSVFTYARFRGSRASRHPDPMSQVGDQVFVFLLGAVFRPTLVALEEETQLERQRLRESVDSIRTTVRENELIVEANKVVTQDTYERLAAYQRELVRRGRTERDVLATAGQILANALLLALLWALLMFYRSDVYGSLGAMLALSLLFAAVIVGAAVNAKFLPGERPELIPIPYAAMLVTVLVGGRAAIVSAMVLAVLVGSQAVFGGVDAVFVATVGGVTAVMSVRSIRRRNQLLASVAAVTAAYFLAAVTVELRLAVPFTEVGLATVLGGVNAMLSAALMTLTLPLFEWMTGTTTELTLLELSDPNRPLLRRLATETPGTYAHSLALANLCEAATNAVGGNGLLTRVGCYYHDIGKLKKPQFFVENQVGGVNPHDKLKPEVSAAMIRNHVREGLALASENRLPEVIKAFISEHHGTMEISYFLDRARSRNGDGEINAEEFRYPGPKPTSLETAIVMLGDGVEAAIRVLEEPTAQKIRDAIDHLTRQRVDAGQLDDAPVTIAQLTRIREEFARVYEGVHHNRIDYPTTSGGLSSDWDATPTA